MAESHDPKQLPRALAAPATAARSLRGRAVAAMGKRGNWLVRADGLPVPVTLHTSAFLRLSPKKRPPAFDRWLDDLRHAGRDLD